MVDCKSERVSTEFLVKMKKSVMETFLLLTESYGEDCMSRACVFEWHKWFSEGRESLKDDDHLGHLCTAVTDDNTEKVQDLIWKDWRLGVRAEAEKVNLDRESVRWILREELNMRKVCVKMVPKCCQMNKKNVTRNCVLTFCNALRMNQICWIW